jgi:hypothetical protein
MPRKSTKGTEVTMTAIDEAINTPVNFQFGEVAEALGIGEVELRERLEDKMGNSEVHQMDTIPVEWEPAIKAIKIDLESEASVRRLNAATEPPIPQPQAQEEPPMLQEEPQPEKKKRSKRSSTALTKKKAEAIQDNRQNASQTQVGIAESLALLSAQEGAQDGANAATAYLHGLVTNMTNVKGQGATVIAAEMLQRTANKSGFNPDEVLEKIGVPLSSQTRETLNDVMGQVLGKAQAATEEVTDTAWGNGYNVQDELTRLKNLMNLSD